MSETKSIYTRLLEAQKLAQAVEKDGTNAFHHYKYVTAESVIQEARSALSKAGLGVFTVQWSIVDCGERGVFIDKVLTQVKDTRVRAVYRLFDDSGSSVDMSSELTVSVEKGKTADKAESASLTQSLSYFLRGLLLLPRVDESVDAKNTTGHVPGPQKPGLVKVAIDPETGEVLPQPTPFDRIVELINAIKDDASYAAASTALQRAKNAHEVDADEFRKLCELGNAAKAKIAKPVVAA